MCRVAFCAFYKISTPTFTVYRNRITDGDLNPVCNSLTRNTNASKINFVWLVDWFKKFTALQGQQVPLRVQRQKTVNGEIVRYLIKIQYTILSGHFAWELHKKIIVTENKPSQSNLPFLSSFKRMLNKQFPIKHDFVY